MFSTLSSHWSEPTPAVQMFVFLSLEEMCGNIEKVHITVIYWEEYLNIRSK